MLPRFSCNDFYSKLVFVARILTWTPFNYRVWARAFANGFKLADFCGVIMKGICVSLYFILYTPNIPRVKCEWGIITSAMFYINLHSYSSLDIMWFLCVLYSSFSWKSTHYIALKIYISKSFVSQFYMQ